MYFEKGVETYPLVERLPKNLIIRSQSTTFYRRRVLSRNRWKNRWPYQWLWNSKRTPSSGTNGLPTKRASSTRRLFQRYWTITLSTF